MAHQKYPVRRQNITEGLNKVKKANAERRKANRYVHPPAGRGRNGTFQVNRQASR
jgi:hypothetical protein